MAPAQTKNDILQGTLALLVLKTLASNGRMHGYAITSHIQRVSADLLLGQNYLCHFSVLHTDTARAAGGFRTGFEGSQDHDLLLRLVANGQYASIRGWRSFVGIPVGFANVEAAHRRARGSAVRQALRLRDMSANPVAFRARGQSLRIDPNIDCALQPADDFHLPNARRAFQLRFENFVSQGCGQFA